MDGSTAPQPRAWHAARQFDDAEDFARALRGAGVDYVPLHAGRYEARLTSLGCDGMMLHRAVDRAHVTRGMTDPGSVVLLFPLHHAVPPTVNGWRAEGQEGLMLGPGSELHALCPADADWASLVLPSPVAGELTALAGLRMAADRPGAALRIPPAVIAPLQRISIAACAALADIDDDDAAPGLLQAIAASLAEQVAAAFVGAAPLTVARATQEAIRLVDAAEAMLRAQPDRPLFTAELCAGLGLSARSLHKAFVAVTGMSPQAYLRRRRLMQVHAALKTGGGDAGLVKSVALAHGFWHLGHFAHAYHAQFGRTPSETLAAARAGSYRRTVLRGGLRQPGAGQG